MTAVAHRRRHALARPAAGLNAYPDLSPPMVETDYAVAGNMAAEEGGTADHGCRWKREMKRPAADDEPSGSISL